MNSLNGNKENNFFLGFFVLITIVSLNAFGPYFKIQSLVTTGLIPALAFISFLYGTRNQISNNHEFLIFLLIFFTGLLSIFYYVNFESFITNLSSLFGAILCAYIPLGLNKDKDYSDFFHWGYIVSILVLIIIMNINGNFNLTNFNSVVDYRNRFLLNANAYSYFSFFANFSLFYLHQKYKSKTFLLFIILLPVLFIIVSFLTQSRSGMLFIILINISYWFFIEKGDNTNRLKKATRTIITFLIFIAFAYQFINLYQNSRIKNRVQQSNTTVDAREVLIQEAINVFSENPYFGVGLGQLTNYTSSGQFSHNSYVEILSEQGIIGGFLLFFLFLLPLRKSIKLFRLNPKNSLAKINILFFLTFYIFNNFYPFYKFPFSMLYFFLIISIQNKAFKDASKKIMII